MNQRACHRALPAALTLCLIAGCGGGSDGGTPVPGKPQLGTAVPPLDVTCSSADLSGLTSVVYAESGGNAEADCGTLEKSCGSVQNAINRCDASGCAVLVGPGEFPQEQITLRNGVHVFGGCRIDPAGEPRWRSVLRGPAGGAAAVVADNITLPTRFENLMVIGADGGSPGAPSVTIAMTSSSALTMTNSTFVGGRGATGATGATAPGHDRTGGRGGHWGTGDNPPDGQKGIPGVGGNTQASPYGGIAGAAGGSGGATSSYRNLGCGYFPGFDGKQGGTFQGPIGGGAGGFSGSTGYSCGLIEPGDGSGGALGPFGYASGPAAPASQDLLGRLVAASWSALAGGADGAPGIGGGGGGGGGAGGGCSDLVPNKVFDGGGGGGGGGGGMGGDPGRGGGMGGASIVMVMSDSSIAGGFVARGTLIPGPGGAGGAGGAGTLGGAGGAGGGGAPRPADITYWPYHCPGSGGPGGQGGIGGAGGGGAGGNGGPSIGIAYRGTTPAPPDFGVYPAQPGAAGGAVGPGGPAIFPILGAGPDGAAGQPGLGFDFAGY